MPKNSNKETLPRIDIMTTVDKNGFPLNTPQTDKIRLRLMALFGVSSPVEIKQYLQTPAGIEAINMVADEIMLEKTYEKQIAQARQDAAIRRHRALGFLLLALLYQKQAKAKARYTAAIEEIERILEHGEKAAKQEANQFTEQAGQMYESMAHHLDELLQQQIKQAETLEAEHESLLEALKDVDHKFELINQQLDDALSLIKNQDKDSLKAHIQTLSEQVDSLSQKIAAKAEKNEDTHQDLHELNALGLKKLMIQSFLEHDFYTQKGEFIQAEDKINRYHEAAFTLKPDLKLVKHDGELMIIGRHENVHDLSIEKCAQAKQIFQTHQQQYSEVSRLCASEKAAERGVLTSRAEKLALRCERLNNRMMIVTNQLYGIESGRQQLSDLKQNAPAPVSHQTRQPNNTNTAQVTHTYRHMLMLSRSFTPKPERLLEIASGFCKNKITDPHIKQLLAKRLQDAGLSKDGDSLHAQILAKGPIQPQTLRELQERVNQRPDQANPLQFSTPF